MAPPTDRFQGPGVVKLTHKTLTLTLTLTLSPETGVVEIFHWQSYLQWSNLPGKMQVPECLSETGREVQSQAWWNLPTRSLPPGHHATCQENIRRATSSGATCQEKMQVLECLSETGREVQSQAWWNFPKQFSTPWRPLPTVFKGQAWWRGPTKKYKSRARRGGHSHAKKK
jgi:hypothetical protein